MKLQSRWNTRENYTSPGVSGCAAASRTNFDKCLQNKFGLGGNPTANCFGSNGTQPTGSRKRAINRKNNRRTRRTRRGKRENFRTLAYDDTDNPFSYKIEYSPVKQIILKYNF